MKITKNTISALILPVLTITLVGNLASCGTIMYPERHGQRAGQIDPLVAGLDGVGLLFFILPGVIAFAVDFNNHSIYLPHGHTSSTGASHQYSRSHVNGTINEASIENFIRTATGLSVDLRQANVQVTRLDSVADLDSRFAGQNEVVRVASSR